MKLYVVSCVPCILAMNVYIYNLAVAFVILTPVMDHVVQVWLSSSKVDTLLVISLVADRRPPIMANLPPMM